MFAGGSSVGRDLIEARVPWPRQRRWRPGEPMTLTEDGTTVTYRLRGVMRDPDPASDWATLTLEPVRTIAAGAEADGPVRRRSAAG